MTSASEWNAIAEACEAASGPDREIDSRIAWNLYMALAGLARERDGVREVNWRWHKPGESKWRPYNSSDDEPYTRSLDAITWMITREFPDPYFCIDRVIRKDGRDWFAMVSGLGWSPKSLRMTTEVFNEKLCAHARTPALALCAAFCRAMAVKAENEAKEVAE